MHWSADYIGLPFEWGGYEREGVYCWGLLCLVQREVFGRVIPRHDEAGAQVEDGQAVPLGIWRSEVETEAVDLAEAVDGDVLHMWGVNSRGRTPLHVGVITGPMQVLHIEAGTGSIVENLTSKRAAWRPIQAYHIV